MRNYIKAELYRNFNRVYFWCFTFIIAGFALLGNIAMKVTSVHPAPYEGLFEAGKRSFVMPVFLIIMIIDMVTAEEQKNNTLKNIVPFGISREKIILSKIITSIILSIISAAIILTVYFGSGAVLFKVSSSFSMSIVTDFMFRLLIATILWIAVIPIGTLLALVFKNNTTFSFIYAGLFLINNIISILIALGFNKLRYIYSIFITTQLKSLSYDILNSRNIMCAVLIGVVYTVVFTILNIVYFRNMEVK